MIKTVLFDMDGVISDTEKLHYNAYKNAFHDIGYEISHDIYVDKLQARNRRIGIENIIHNASNDQIDEVSRLKDLYYKKELENGIHLYEDAFSLIQVLKENEIKIAVVSASSYAEYQIRKMDLFEYFEFVISGTDNLHIKNKPSPDIYIYALEKLNAKPEETIIIEDSMNGIKSALGSKSKVIGIDRGYLGEINDKNLLIVDDLTRIIKFLN